MGAAAQIYSTRLSESICTLDGGCITTASLPEIVLHTFSGKVRRLAHGDVRTDVACGQPARLIGRGEGSPHPALT